MAYYLIISRVAFDNQFEFEPTSFVAKESYEH